MTHPSNTKVSAPLSHREGQGVGPLGLSILIPTYNYACAHLVCELQKQCEEVEATLPGFEYEIIVADDGSTDVETTTKNATIECLPHCRFEMRDENVGRAAIRNWLVNEARGEWLLIIDCDAEVMSDDFILRYWEETKGGDAIVVGGLSTPKECDKGCELRHRYELAADVIRTVEARRKKPAMFFSTFNFLCPRNVLLAIPFDERCVEYGYEDALFGIEAEARGIPIVHIDNPLLHLGINDNAAFLRNSEAALRTLKRLGPPMTERSRVGHAAARFTASAWRRYTLLPLFLIIYKMSRPLLRRNLLSSRPSLRLFAFYKLGYYLSLS